MHVAVAYGELGSGYRQIRYVGRYVTSALAEVDRLPQRGRELSVLFPGNSPQARDIHPPRVSAYLPQRQRVRISDFADRTSQLCQLLTSAQNSAVVRPVCRDLDC